MAGVPQKLYHYTSKDQAHQIERDGVIKSTPGDSKHAKFGQGVYLSDVPPSSSDRDIVKANWGGQARQEKTETAFEVDTRRMNVKRYEEESRTVYKVDDDVRVGSNSRIDRK